MDRSNHIKLSECGNFIFEEKKMFDLWTLFFCSVTSGQMSTLLYFDIFQVFEILDIGSGEWSTALYFW